MPSPDLQFAFGVRFRGRQLNRWAIRVRARLSRFERRAAGGPSDAWLINESIELIEKALGALAEVESRLEDAALWIDSDARCLELLYQPLTLAERAVKSVEWQFYPILRARQKSDADYDRLAAHLLAELELREIVPITCRALLMPSPLSYHYLSNGRTAFTFYPSIRSLDATALLYHEIGHAFQYFCHHRWLRNAPANAAARLDNIREQVAAAYRHGRRRAPVNEIVSDMFAGLVGGVAYPASLCAAFFACDSLWEPPPKDEPEPALYPGPACRVTVARLAATHGAGRRHDAFPDDLFDAWEKLGHLQSRHKRDGGLGDFRLAELDKPLAALAHLLEDHKIALARAIPRPAFGRSGIPTPQARRNLRQMLLAGAWARIATAFSPEYVDWERAALQELGVWKNG